MSASSQLIFSTTTYLAGSIAVGVGEVADAYATLRLRGRLVEWLATAFGFFEFAWAGVSFLVWRRADQALPAWLPVSYVACTVAAAAAAVVVVIQHRHSDEVPVPADLTIAMGAFGAFFAVAAGACLEKVS